MDINDALPVLVGAAAGKLSLVRIHLRARLQHPDPGDTSTALDAVRSALRCLDEADAHLDRAVPKPSGLRRAA